jgi:chromosome segregation ATPase
MPSTPTTTTTAVSERYEEELRQLKARAEGKIAEADRELRAAKKSVADRRLGLPDAGKGLEAVEASLAEKIAKAEDKLKLWQAILPQVEAKLAAVPAARAAAAAAEGPLRDALVDRDAAFEDAQAALEVLIDRLWDVREKNMTAVQALSTYQKAALGAVAHTHAAASTIWKSLRWPDKLRVAVKGRGHERSGTTPLIVFDLRDDESNPVIRTAPDPGALDAEYLQHMGEA